MRFILFVEGGAEKTSIKFIKKWLDPQLKKPVGIQPVNFKSVHKFLDGIKGKAHAHLEGPKRGEIIAGIGLLDLYGFPKIPSDRMMIDEKRDWAVHHVDRLVGHPKFRMFFAVHEFEAWLFSQPENLPQPVRDKLGRSLKLPEKINFNDPPSNKLETLYGKNLNRGYKKTVDGVNLFGKLDPSIARDKCPYLKKMLDEMLTMARGAGL